MSAARRSASRDEVAGWLREALARSGREARVTIGETVHDGPSSIVLRARLDPGATDVAVKLCFEPGSATAWPDEAVRQHDAQQVVAARMGSGDAYRVPAPIAVSPERAMIVLEWADGRSLASLLHDAGTSRAAARALVRRAGGWLRRFHECHPLAPARTDVAQRLRTMDDALAAAPPLVRRDPAVVRAGALVHGAAPAAAAVALERSWLHGDFKPHDILLADGITYGTDIGRLHENVCLFDVAQFLNHLDLLVLHPGALRLLGAGDTLVDAFLDGFLPRGVGDAGLPLAWIRLVSAMRLWATYGHRPGAPLVNAVNRWRYRSLVGRLHRALDRYAG